MIRRPAGVFGLALALLAACADPKGGGGGTPTPAPGVCAGVAEVGGTSIRLQLVADGLDRPVLVTAPAGVVTQLFVVEQRGRVRLIEAAGVFALPFLDLSGRVSCCGERGLLSLAFHPQYRQNGRFFVLYTDLVGDVRVSEFVASSASFADAATERVLVRVPHAIFANHNGGHLAFGPDSRLYVGVGDGGGSRDPLRSAQDPSVLLGKILRLDVDASSLIPADNPFGNPVWHLGLRNPWRFSFDRVTGDLYIGDVGQDAYEEINFAPSPLRAGVNWGWSLMEGNGHCVNDPACASRAVAPPILEYAHQNGACAVTGGHVYRGCVLKDLRGQYLFGDFCAGFIGAFRVVNGEARDQRDLTAMLGPVFNLSSFGEDARGELYVVTLGGAIYQIVPR